MNFQASIRIFLKILYKVIPVNKKRILFMSFNGHYSDNPKCISQKIYELAPQFEQVWLIKKNYAKNLPDYVKAVNIDSLFSNFWYKATARVIVDNVYGEKATSQGQSKLSALKFRLYTFLNHKPSQHIFTTWHGTPLKKMGRDQIGLTISNFSCPNTTMILGNQYTLDIMRHITFDKIQMELIGTPRNDILFSDSSEELKAKLGLPVDKKIIMFAPTFRSDNFNGTINQNLFRSGINQLNEIDFELLFQKLSEVFGGEWVLVCRFHYHVETMVDWEQLNLKHPGCIINGNLNDDMADYLACADALLTDASSSMFDYAHTRKPCFLIFPDVDHYRNSERGFYLPIEELPFKVAENFPELLRNISAFNEVRYLDGIQALLNKLGYVDDINSTAKVSEYILGSEFLNEELN